MTERKSRSERFRAFLRKPYVRIPLLLVILLYVGFVIVLIFIAISSLYVLGILVGTPTLQLVTGAISAISAAASATAAILIWRGNVQARKTVLIDRVLGPAYSEIRQTSELLDSWKSDAVDTGLNTPFLKQLGSDWRYYTLDQTLRTDLENLRDSVTNSWKPKGAIEDRRWSCYQGDCKDTLQSTKHQCSTSLGL